MTIMISSMGVAVGGALARRGFGCGAVAAGLLLAASGCPQGPDNGAPSYVNGPTPAVYYYGDSLGAMSRQGARDLYAVAAPSATVHDNTMVGGTFLQDWTPAMGNVPAGATVVVALGTDNLLNETHDVTALHMLASLNTLREAGAGRVVWLTINEYVGRLRGYPYTSRVNWLNDYVRRLVADGAYADVGLEVYPWDDYANRPGAQGAWISGDNLHHNAAGTAAYSCAMYEAAMGPACMADILEAS